MTILSSSITGLLLSTWLAVGQQARRIDDAALRNAGRTGEEWLAYDGKQYVSFMGGTGQANAVPPKLLTFVLDGKEPLPQ